jgi:hypothetical protein
LTCTSFSCLPAGLTVRAATSCPCTSSNRPSAAPGNPSYARPCQQDTPAAAAAALQTSWALHARCCLNSGVC